jgi:hypothetical protein
LRRQNSAQAVTAAAAKTAPGRHPPQDSKTTKKLPVWHEFTKQMASFTYCCPNTGAMVQGFVVVEEIPERFNFEPEDGPYESMYCESCRQAHFVNVKTGKVLGENEDDEAAINSG